MMQWPDNTRSAYSNNVVANKKDVSSVNAQGSPSSTNNNRTEDKGPRAPLLATAGANAASDHLQFCLSMIPQSCSFCGVHPFQWGREEVQQWLKWCISEFSFTDVQTEKFAMNGKALILLKKQDFIDRAPSAGDVLYNVLHKLLETQSKSASMAPLSAASVAEQAVMLNLMMAANNPFFSPGLLPAFPPVPFAGSLSRNNLPLTPPATCSPHDQSVSTANKTSDLVNSSSKFSRSHSQSPGDMKHNPHHSDVVYSTHTHNNENETKSLPIGSSLSSFAMAESVIKPNHTFSLKKEDSVDMISSSSRTKSDCRLLWEFISKLLKDSSYTDYIKWENMSDYTFRIVNPAQLSRLWGIQKNRTNMTYEKLSRALRYYYRMDIIEKVPGRRLTYRFMRPPHEIKRGQRGAKPGVPRKSRSTDEEVEEIEEVEAMEALEGELSDDDNRLPSNDYSSAAGDYFPKQEVTTAADSSHPLDLVSHQRHSNMYGSALNKIGDTGNIIPKSEPIASHYNVQRPAPSITTVIKSEIPEWSAATSTNDRGASPHIPGE